MKAYHDYLAIQQNEVQHIYRNIEHDKVKAVSDLILRQEAKGHRIHITGIGKPGHVAQYIASLFSSIGAPSYFLDATEAIHGSSGQVKEGDVVIAISNSGETEELIKTVKTLQNNHAHVVSVTGNDGSWLAKHTDYTLYAGVRQEGDPLNKPPRSSILAEVIVLQALSVCLQEAYQLDVKTYVKWHPGGSLGKSIDNS